MRSTAINIKIFPSLVVSFAAVFWDVTQRSPQRNFGGALRDIPKKRLRRRLSPWCLILFCLFLLLLLFFFVFVSYRYNTKANFIKGRCPGSEAMVFSDPDADNEMTRVKVPNVNIGDCDYTIAFWIRLLHPRAVSTISGQSRSGKLLALDISGMFVAACSAVSTATLIHTTCVYVSLSVVANNWTHIAVTCEQDNRVKIFSDGEIANITYWQNFSDQDVLPFIGTLPPKEVFVHYYDSTVIMDLHILGFALPPDEIYDLYKG